MSTNELSLTAHTEDVGKRIDVYLSEKVDGLTRSAAQSLLLEQAVKLEGRTLKKNYRLLGNETFTVNMPLLKTLDIQPENIPLDIVFEDRDIIVINKPRGMVVHPAAGNWTGTLVHALMYHCGESLSGINGILRPGIVHRIDKDTSGLLVVAKNDISHQSLAAQIASHTAFREYEGIVVGQIKEENGTVDKPIARHKTDRIRMAVCKSGKTAVTHYTVLGYYPGYTHMGFRLETGRTHQIRVHMASIGHPIIGDPLYGLKKDRFSDIGGQCLHAAKLELSHPATGERMCFYAPLPEYFTHILEKLEREIK